MTKPSPFIFKDGMNSFSYIWHCTEQRPLEYSSKTKSLKFIIALKIILFTESSVIHKITFLV